MNKFLHSQFRPLLFLPLLAVFAGLLTSCKSEPSSLLLDTSCVPPCWYNIVPGESTTSDVWSIIPEITGVNASSISEINSKSYGITHHIEWRFNKESGDSRGSIYFSNDFVYMINIQPKKGALILEDAIGLLGEPEYTFAYKEIGEIYRMIIFLLYPTKGYILLYAAERFTSQSSIIVQDHPIIAVYYFDPRVYDDLVQYGPWIQESISTLEQYQRPWTGYGEIFYFQEHMR